MLRTMYDAATLAAVAIGGVLGATLRWAIARSNESSQLDGGWFRYEPNTSASSNLNGSGFELVRSTETIATAGGIPLDTLIVNTLGCLLLGLLTLLLVRSTGSTRRLLIGAATGLCGSLTTFSTFALEIAVLLRGRPTLPPKLEGLHLSTGRALPTAVTYILLSLAAGAIAFWLGRSVAKRIVITPGDITIGEAT